MTLGPNQPSYDVLIVGAGIAGSAVAVAFARQGRKVMLLERSLAKPDRIVGELLQPGGVEALAQLGLADCLEGINAIPVKGYHLFWKDLQTTFWFTSSDLSPSKSVKTGSSRIQTPEGRSFHHGDFVVKLREAAEAEDFVTVVEATARELIRDESSGRVVGVECSQGDGPTTKVRHI
jgi:squalene monooxygenase